MLPRALVALRLLSPGKRLPPLHFFCSTDASEGDMDLQRLRQSEQGKELWNEQVSKEDKRETAVVKFYNRATPNLLLSVVGIKGEDTAAILRRRILAPFSSSEASTKRRRFQKRNLRILRYLDDGVEDGDYLKRLPNPVRAQVTAILNTAPAEQLVKLKVTHPQGMDEEAANQIIAAREERGEFHSPFDLGEVLGLERAAEVVRFLAHVLDEQNLDSEETKKEIRERTEKAMLQNRTRAFLSGQPDPAILRSATSLVSIFTDTAGYFWVEMDVPSGRVISKSVTLNDPERPMTKGVLSQGIGDWLDRLRVEIPQAPLYALSLSLFDYNNSADDRRKRTRRGTQYASLNSRLVQVRTQEAIIATALASRSPSDEGRSGDRVLVVSPPCVARHFGVGATALEVSDARSKARGLAHSRWPLPMSGVHAAESDIGLPELPEGELAVVGRGHFEHLLSMAYLQGLFLLDAHLLRYHRRTNRKDLYSARRFTNNNYRV